MWRGSRRGGCRRRPPEGSSRRAAASRRAGGAAGGGVPRRGGRYPWRRRGQAARVDYEYERHGVRHQLLRGEPLRGWRQVQVTERRTRRDYAECIRELVDIHCPEAPLIRRVQGNLNTHDGASLSEAFPPGEARRLLDEIEFHSTPRHGSWPNMAETGIKSRNRRCPERRLDSRPLMAAAVAAWEQRRNSATARIHWTSTLAAARRKLRRLYPSIEV